MTSKEKFKALVSEEATSTIKRNKERITNRARLRESQQIALKVLSKLDELGWSQSRLAKAMGVVPQQITKIVKGKENLTLDTQIRLQEILDIPILASYYESKFEETEAIKVEGSFDYKVPSYTISEYAIVLPKKEIKMVYDDELKQYDYFLQNVV